MNKLQGTITEMETHEGLSLLTVRVGDDTFSSLVGNSPEISAFCKVGGPILLTFKETEVAIGKGLSGGLSMRNRFPAELTSLTSGPLLTYLTLRYRDGFIQSVITTRSAQELSLSIGDHVEALVKTNETLVEGVDH
jgi:molybdopterin-binding protein